MSLRALQDATGLDRRYLSALERGEVEEIGADRAEALAGVLDAPIAAITQGDSDVTAQAAEAPPIEAGDDELKRYTPEEVYANGWLPWSARKIREKAYSREIYAHTDGGKITLTREDIRLTSAMGAITPVEIPSPRSPRRPAA